MAHKHRFSAAESLDTPGARIRLMREAKGWSQEVLAKKVNATQPAVSQWENNHWTPTLGMQIALAEALCATRHFLFGEVAA